MLAERMILSEAIEAATAIISGYPNGGANAGDSYIGALASTLMGYPRQVAMRCADYPRRMGERLRGVASACKFLPTPADVIAWCEREVEPLYERSAREERVTQQLADRQEYERREQDRSQRLSVDELKAKYGDWTREIGGVVEPRWYDKPIREVSADEITVSPFLEAAIERQNDEAAE